MKFKKNKGFTLLEVIVTSAILLAVTPMLLAIIVNIQENTLFNIASSVQRSSDSSGLARIGRVINSSSKFIARNIDITTEIPPSGAIGTPASISQFYLKALDIPSSYSFGGVTYRPLDITSRVLPVYDPSGTFSPTNITQTTTQNAFNPINVGNSLMNITIEDYITYPYTVNGGYSSTSTFKKRFPLYQIHYFYLVQSNNPQFGIRRNNVDTSMNGKSLLLVEWKSQYLLDYTELNSFFSCTVPCGFGPALTSNVMLTNFRNSITNGNVKPDFMPNIPIAGIIKQSETAYITTGASANTPIGFSLAGATASTNATSPGGLTGPEYGTGGIPMQSIENVLRYPSSGGDTAYGIAANNYSQTGGKVATGSITDDNRRVPFFKTTVDGDVNTSLPTPLNGFPHGFEVMLSGTSGSTKVFIRLNSWATAKGVSSYNPSMITFQGKN